MFRSFCTAILFLTVAPWAHAVPLNAPSTDRVSWEQISGGDLDLGSLPTKASLETTPSPSGPHLRLKLEVKDHPALNSVIPLEISLHDAYGHTYLSPSSPSQPFDVSVTELPSGSFRAEIFRNTGNNPGSLPEAVSIPLDPVLP